MSTPLSHVWALTRPLCRTRHARFAREKEPFAFDAADGALWRCRCLDCGVEFACALGSEETGYDYAGEEEGGFTYHAIGDES